MKICADENISPVLTTLLREALLGKAHTLDTVDDHQARSVDDEIWVRRFALAGGEAIVGADAKMLTRPHEIVAISEAGLRLIVLPSQWVTQRRHLQVSYLFYWWPHIEAILETSKPGQIFKAPWGWGETNGTIKPFKVDVQEARKKMRKAERRNP